MLENDEDDNAGSDENDEDDCSGENHEIMVMVLMRMRKIMVVVVVGIMMMIVVRMIRIMMAESLTRVSIVHIHVVLCAVCVWDGTNLKEYPMKRWQQNSFSLRVLLP